MLSYEATIVYLERKLERCHYKNREYVAGELQAARNGIGQTVFDIIVEIIEEHRSGGTQSGDVELELL